MVHKKVQAGILGATGSVGQKFVQLLSNHPWFDIAAVAASGRSAGRFFSEAVNWFQASQLDPTIGEMIVSECLPSLPCKVVFSALDASIAGEIEEEFARRGYFVFSNSRNHRMDPTVPLLVPEINPGHLELIRAQKFGTGAIVTNPNCSAIGLAMALKPLIDCFGVTQVHVVTMQALSGAGYPGVASLDILDNVIPFISGEEEKMETEPLKILGKLENESIRFAEIKISASCNRVAVQDGHLECVSVKLGRSASLQEIRSAWKGFSAEPQQLQLPMAPAHPLYYFEEANYPQPKIHRDLDGGMAVTIGRLRPCSLLDYKFVLLSHNTIRGAAGGAILNAELAFKKGLF
ncbi:aspartate-semialdehyde dehydrogenase [bacterium]|nr:aspartate-semialdehyde dehydrogenase [bacterium]